MWHFIMWVGRLVLVLLIGEVTMLVGAKMVSQGDAYYDPIALYQDLMPGTSTTSLVGLNCQRQFEAVSRDTIDNCRLPLLAGAFRTAEVFGRGQLIQTVVFQSNDMHLGDLPHSWGIPTIAGFGSNSFARWEVGVYDVRAYLQPNRQPYSLWSLITRIVIWRR